MSFCDGFILAFKEFTLGHNLCCEASRLVGRRGGGGGGFRESNKVELNKSCGGGRRGRSPSPS